MVIGLQFFLCLFLYWREQGNFFPFGERQRWKVVAFPLLPGSFLKASIGRLIREANITYSLWCRWKITISLEGHDGLHKTSAQMKLETPGRVWRQTDSPSPYTNHTLTCGLVLKSADSWPKYWNFFIWFSRASSPVNPKCYCVFLFFSHVDLNVRGLWVRIRGLTKFLNFSFSKKKK